jgi:hypothetical protein
MNRAGQSRCRLWGSLSLQPPRDVACIRQVFAFFFLSPPVRAVGGHGRVGEASLAPCIPVLPLFRGVSSETQLHVGAICICEGMCDGYTPLCMRARDADHSRGMVPDLVWYSQIAAIARGVEPLVGSCMNLTPPSYQRHVQSQG